MSLSPFDSFQSRFVTYLLNFPRNIEYNRPLLTSCMLSPLSISTALNIDSTSDFSPQFILQVILRTDAAMISPYFRNYIYTTLAVQYTLQIVYPCSLIENMRDFPIHAYKAYEKVTCIDTAYAGNLNSVEVMDGSM